MTSSTIGHALDPVPALGATTPSRSAIAAATGRGSSTGANAAPAASLGLAAAAVKILDRAVEDSVAPGAKPRPGQAMMLKDLVEAMLDDGHGQAQAEGPTGVGKSFVYLTVAAAAMAARSERSVVSTESLALQAQIVDKDAPVIAAACEAVTGFRPQFAVLKGWSNYVCTQATVDSANDMLDRLGRTGDAEPKALSRKFDKAVADKGKMLFGEQKERADVLAWALRQAVGAGDPRVTGDKNAYPGNMNDSMTWDSVSVSSADCIGADRCVFADECLPRAAKARAAEADVVVTNHHLLAVQAANDVPVVIGSKTLGEFHHVFVDEGHGLPQIVRSQGAVEISSRAVLSLARAVGKVLDDRETSVKNWMDAGAGVAQYVNEDLKEKAQRIGGRDTVLRLGEGQEPLESSFAVVDRWLTEAVEMLKRAAKSNSAPAAEIGLKRARGRVEGMKSALDLVSEHKPGAARWVEVVTPHPRATDQTKYPVVRYTPVDVAGMIRRSLWTREMTEEELEAVGWSEQSAPVEEESSAPEGPKPRVPLTSAVLSATMPPGFGRQVGIRAPLRKYPSPFDSAYGSSVLFVPRAVDQADLQALGSSAYGKFKFDTAKHRAWALRHMIDLVEANGGSALILAATASSGKEYAAALKSAARGRWDVLSQWDGVALRKQVAAWKADRASVMVGTRSLMTGVDAAGDTCTLVVVDRPARAASNPVDDARVEALVANADMDKWAADRFCYVSDASLLLEQSAGRLIRKVSDSGMLAVLDPRLLKAGPFSYPEPTRRMYLDTLHRFETKISVPEAAHQWLRNQQARHAGAQAS
ncbi:ATP-dependent DNA helicase [Nocardioides sp. Leaf285]|uniref:ATP-dependent DNA helicase n=1 Tax=Nocardioides sp. Leaf285 TaxID=1736322 RepID=UPI000A8EC21D|nr:helicase C-terminal domain-containing protein [Nocardioides sp. Leaf285]